MKIPITTWAQRHYSPAPSAFTLRKWAREGQIHPAPEKVGRDWFVDEGAKRLAGAAPRASLVERLRAA